MQKIQFFGAAGEVTGSSYLVTGDDGGRLLIDLGMFQGTNAETRNFSPLNFNAVSLRAVVLTHAHLDHCGRLPLLIKAGFAGKIYTTAATEMITRISLLDAAAVAQEENKEPLLYTEADVSKTCDQM